MSPARRWSSAPHQLATGFWGNDEATAVAAVVEGIDRGIAWFDTAPLYGAGRASAASAPRSLARADADVVVSTKVGRPVVIGDGGPETAFDYSASGTRRSLEDSLTRLGRDHVDIVHVHDPDDHLDVALDECSPRSPTCAPRGRWGGVGRHDGVRDGLRVLAEAGPDLVMIANRLTLLDRDALDELAPACAAAGVPLVAAAPFDSGSLACAPVPGSWFDSPRRCGSAAPGPGDGSRQCDDAGVSLHAAALQYPLRHGADHSGGRRDGVGGRGRRKRRPGRRANPRRPVDRPRGDLTTDRVPTGWVTRPGPSDQLVPSGCGG